MLPALLDINSLQPLYGIRQLNEITTRWQLLGSKTWAPTWNVELSVVGGKTTVSEHYLMKNVFNSRQLRIFRRKTGWSPKQMTEIWVIEIPISEITLGDTENFKTFERKCWLFLSDRLQCSRSCSCSNKNWNYELEGLSFGPEPVWRHLIVAPENKSFNFRAGDFSLLGIYTKE